MAPEALLPKPESLALPPKRREAGKWWVAASVLTGTFLSVMDVSVVNVAMPHMMGSFGQDLLSITWVSTAYSIAEIIMITMTAFWSRLLGRKRLFLMSTRFSSPVRSSPAPRRRLRRCSAGVWYREPAAAR